MPRVNYETRGVSLVKTNYRFRFDYFERSFFPSLFEVGRQSLVYNNTNSFAYFPS